MWNLPPSHAPRRLEPRSATACESRPKIFSWFCPPKIIWNLWHLTIFWPYDFTITLVLFDIFLGCLTIFDHGAGDFGGMFFTIFHQQLQHTSEFLPGFIQSQHTSIIFPIIKHVFKTKKTTWNRKHTPQWFHMDQLSRWIIVRKPMDYIWSYGSLMFCQLPHISTIVWCPPVMPVGS